MRILVTGGAGVRPSPADPLLYESVNVGETIQLLEAARRCGVRKFVVSGVVAARDYDSRFEGVNLGNSLPARLKDLIAALEQALGLKADIDRLPEQQGDVPIACADIAKASRCLGYRPQTSFAGGIRRFVNWYSAANA
jgi:UDP-glucuronate 4-epimerase